MKKLTFITLATLLAMEMTFGGCSSGDNNASETSVPPNATKITMYTKTFNSWADDYMKQRVNEFNSTQSEVNVTLKIYYENELYWNAITAARENGLAPDIYLVSYSTMTREYEAGNIVAINGYLTEEQKGDVYSHVWDLVKFHEDYYAYPWYTEPSTLFYSRSDVLKKLGYDNPPQTFAELYEICEKMASTLPIGRYCLSLPITQSDLSWTTVGLQQNLTGGLAVTDDWMTCRLEEAGYKELTNFFYTCIKNKWAAPATLTSEGYADNAISLTEDKAMMCWAGSWNISLLYEKYPEYVDSIDISTIPTLDGDEEKCTATNGGWAYGISSHSSKTKQDAAWKFIEWMAAGDVERDAEYFKVEHMAKVPVRQSIAKYMETAEYDMKQEWAEVVTKVASHAIPEVRYSSDISYAVAEMLENCVLNTNKAFESLYASSLNTALSNIARIMSRTTYKPNPYQ